MVNVNTQAVIWDTCVLITDVSSFQEGRIERFNFFTVNLNEEDLSK